jgi:hypothetical protein
MVCLEPFTPDEFYSWYRHLGRLRLFWAKPLLELLPLYSVSGGCVMKARWASHRPRIEEAYIVVLRRVKGADFLLSLRGTKILITPGEIERELYQLRGAIHVFSTLRPCASGIHAERLPAGHPEPGPDHIVIASGSDAKYVIYLNRWNFNIDYLWAPSAEYIRSAIEGALCEARRLGGRYVTAAFGGEPPDTGPYRPDYSYNVYKLAF